MKELKELKQWVLWVKVPRGKREAKIPYAANGYPARTNDAKTWCSYEKAVEVYMANPERYSGIGFVFTENDPYCGIDLDHCVNGGEIEGWAAEIIENLDSYTEFSPSGTGVHVLARGKKPTTKCKKGLFEVYEKGRYFTVTGDRIRGEIRDIQGELEKLCEVNL